MIYCDCLTMEGVSTASQQKVSLTPPWMPLDGLIEVWAAFGKVATAATATKAISLAFAALTEERTALRHCSFARTERWRRSLTITSWMQGLHEQECAIEALIKAASFWLEVASSLERFLTEVDSSQGETIEQEIRALVGCAIEQRVRVWTIAHHLVHEHLMCYRRAYEDTLQGGDPLQNKERQP